ncbi:hypothetical protein RIF29_05540 [Crotalaria pallida]|uniref:Bifunctional inhibitor/plant lipid transfer protein/seed storage helical domain-containing protein n=1 Tax=Crotalaria pallida TaxID=3830 RepID=A0AAN9PAP5_CROPI
MAKLTFLIALLAVLVLAVHASTTLRSRESSCKKQIERANLKHCERHVMQRIQEQEEEEEEGEGEEDRIRKLRGIIKHHHHVVKSLRHRNSQQQQQQEEEEAQEQFEKCCEELNDINSQRCKCRALQQIFENQSQQLEGREQEEQLEREVEKLPRSCGLRPIRGCEVNPDEEE